MEAYYIVMIVKSPVNIQFGQRIAGLRKNAQLSQEALALRSGINRTYMGAVERGEKTPSLLVINKIARALGLTLKQLFDYE